MELVEHIKLFQQQPISEYAQNYTINKLMKFRMKNKNLFFR